MLWGFGAGCVCFFWGFFTRFAFRGSCFLLVGSLFVWGHYLQRGLMRGFVFRAKKSAWGLFFYGLFALFFGWWDFLGFCLWLFRCA